MRALAPSGTQRPAVRRVTPAVRLLMPAVPRAIPAVRMLMPPARSAVGSSVFAWRAGSSAPLRRPGSSVFAWCAGSSASLRRRPARMTRAPRAPSAPAPAGSLRRPRHAMPRARPRLPPATLTQRARPRLPPARLTPRARSRAARPPPASKRPRRSREPGAVRPPGARRPGHPDASALPARRRSLPRPRRTPGAAAHVVVSSPPGSASLTPGSRVASPPTAATPR